jgi:uncharacterized membrane protein YjgN (DUF898 family)
MGVGNQDQTAFAFEGKWREFAPIAYTNLLLTFATLGFYRFWGTTRERQYFWSNTRFIDDTMEWTGTGKELFFGFLIALFAFGLPFLVLNLILQGLLFQNQQVIAGILVVAIYVGLLYLGGVAMFRGLRYRLSRSYWHGIHGGTDSGGWKYGWSYLWKNVVAYICLALLFPWSMTALWKERWEAMTFGPHRFVSKPDWGSLMPRFLIAYLSPIVIIIGMIVALIPIAIAAGTGIGDDPESVGTVFAITAFLVLGIYILWPLAALVYYAAYMRQVINSMTLSTLEFEFTASTKAWIKLFLGNVGLYLLAAAAAAIPIGALGLFAQFGDITPGESAFASNPFAFAAFIAILAIPFGLVGPFVRYRNWGFFVRHMEAGGEINLARLTQSDTKELKQGEGLLDAFDMGAM